jgi:FkbM family methyltransferase
MDKSKSKSKSAKNKITKLGSKKSKSKSASKKKITKLGSKKKSKSKSASKKKITKLGSKKKSKSKKTSKRYSNPSSDKKDTFKKSYNNIIKQSPIKMDIIDLHGNIVNTNEVEIYEQILVNKYILEDDVVLELGARYGSISCVINSKLNNKDNHIVVEPDTRVWDALEKNKKNNNCYFNIVKGFISNKKLNLTNLDVWDGYGARFIEDDNTQIPSYTLDEIKLKYNKNFNVLVADCEGCLEMFFDENPNFYDNLRLIIFEADYPKKCNYAKIKNKLIEKKFNKILEGHQNIWIRYIL